jgi:hypothetical protein
MLFAGEALSCAGELLLLSADAGLDRADAGGLLLAAKPFATAASNRTSRYLEERISVRRRQRLQRGTYDTLNETGCLKLALSVSRIAHTRPTPPDARRVKQGELRSTTTERKP